MRFVGVDIGKESHTVAAVDESQAVLVRPTQITIQAERGDVVNRTVLLRAVVGLANLALIRTEEGAFEEAERLNRRAIDAFARVRLGDGARRPAHGEERRPEDEDAELLPGPDHRKSPSA